ncbi:hypothetical protein [Legionella taurinensis]|nr:hypothetical protein [Legionella taurinensis]MDX1835979.1 hypothetical protein [Legionella taurinensis]
MNERHCLDLASIIETHGKMAMGFVPAMQGKGCLRALLLLE